jgi:peptide/nickel transport system ATP-binding protein
LLVSHDLAVVNLMCDDLLVLQSGRVVEQGAAEHIFKNAVHPYTRALLAAVPGSREDFF